MGWPRALSSLGLSKIMRQIGLPAGVNRDHLGPHPRALARRFAWADIDRLLGVFFNC